MTRPSPGAGSCGSSCSRGIEPAAMPEALLARSPRGAGERETRPPSFSCGPRRCCHPQPQPQPHPRAVPRWEARTHPALVPICCSIGSSSRARDVSMRLPLGKSFQCSSSMDVSSQTAGFFRAVSQSGGSIVPGFLWI